MTVPSAVTGEVHVLSPREGGGTRTAAIFPISRPVAGVAEVELNFIADAGSYVAYKQLSGSHLRYRLANAGETVPGSARWLNAETSAVGDIQGAPVVGLTVKLALLVEYESTGRESLDAKVIKADALAQASAKSALKASDFLALEGIGRKSVVIGSVSRTYTSNANVLYGYGPSEPSPGGRVQKVSAVFSGSGTAVLEAIGPDNVVIARHPVAFVNGANEWLANVSFPELHVPAGGRVYIRAAGGNNVRYTGGTAVMTH